MSSIRKHFIYNYIILFSLIVFEGFQTISTTINSIPSSGIYYQHSTLNKRLTLPIKNLTYNVEIDEAISRVEIIQYYYKV